MEYLLRSKGLYHITLGKETTPTDANKKVKWDNRNGEARRLIRMSISHDLRFYLQSIDQPKESPDKIESVFGKHNIIRAQQLENQVPNLCPNDFYCIECSTTHVFQQRTNTFSNHSHNQIKDQHTDVFTW
jgi:hypothetical protein